MQMKFVVTLLLTLFLVSPIFAQDIIKISGFQTAATGPLRDAKIGSDPVRLPKPGKIIKVEGNHDGFWINEVTRWGEQTIARFSKTSEAIGYSLEEGKYTVYPNVPHLSSSANVTIHIELTGRAAVDIDKELLLKLVAALKRMANDLGWEYQGEMLGKYRKDQYDAGDRAWQIQKLDGSRSYNTHAYFSPTVRKLNREELEKKENPGFPYRADYKSIISTSAGSAINRGYYRKETKIESGTAGMCPMDAVELYRDNYVITVQVSDCTEGVQVEKQSSVKYLETYLKYLDEIDQAGTITAYGQQIKGTGYLRDAKLAEKPFRVPRGGATIVKVKCTGKGFWIRKVGEGIPFVSFDKASDAIGYNLPAGEYVIYPNLGPNQNSAEVWLDLSIE